MGLVSCHCLVCTIHPFDLREKDGIRYWHWCFYNDHIDSFSVTFELSFVSGIETSIERLVWVKTSNFLDVVGSFLWILNISNKISLCPNSKDVTCWSSNFLASFYSYREGFSSNMPLISYPIKINK